MKNQIFRKVILAALAGSVFANPASAGSVAGFGGSTEITQILNNAELAGQSAQMYQQVQNTITQIQHSQQQLRNLIAAPQMEWGSAQAELQQLTQLVAKGQALGYSLGNIDQQFATKYRGYNGVALKNNFQGASQTWVRTSLDSMSSAMSVAGLQSSQFANEQMAMDRIQSMTAGAPGQLAVSQAGVMVAGQQVTQLQKLRQLFMAQMQAQNAYMAQQTDSQAAEANTANAHFKKYQGSAPGFSSSGGKH